MWVEGKIIWPASSLCNNWFETEPSAFRLLDWVTPLAVIRLAAINKTGGLLVNDHRSVGQIKV